jgi:hypothetical protein
MMNTSQRVLITFSVASSRNAICSSLSQFNPLLPSSVTLPTTPQFACYIIKSILWLFHLLFYLLLLVLAEKTYLVLDGT